MSLKKRLGSWKEEAMTKDFQKELLEKVKEGVKPSDLKKKKPVIIPQDEGYESDKSDKSVPVAPPLPNSLQNQITSLKKQLQLYKDFRESDLKIKEDLKQTIEQLREENKLLEEKISRLEKASKNPAKIKEIPQPELKEPKHYLFTCSICDQNKKSQLHLAKVNGLGIDPTKLQKICDYCIKRVDLIQEPKEDFF